MLIPTAVATLLVLLIVALGLILFKIFLKLYIAQQRDCGSSQPHSKTAFDATKPQEGIANPIGRFPEIKSTHGELTKATGIQDVQGRAKRRDEYHESGQQSDPGTKERVNERQDFVVGGYMIGGRTFDALVVGYYEGDQLTYAAHTRNGFTPQLREALMRHFLGLEITECPFTNLPENKRRRRGQGLTAARMKNCRWLKPALVGQFEFREWTPDGHLSYSRFVGLRYDRNPHEVTRKQTARSR